MAEIQYLLNPTHITTPGAHTAEVITNVPSGSISAVTVQNALNEIGNRNYAGSSIAGGAAADSSKLGGQLPSHYETAIGKPSANGYLLSSTTAGVRSWVAPYSHPATHAQSVIDSSTGWITDALAGKQASGNYAGAPDVGQWTPEITSSTPPTGVTYYWRSGSYTRIGGVCYAWFGVSVSSLGSGGGGDLIMTGLPFVCRDTEAGTVWMPGGFFAGLVNAIDAYANAIGVNEGTDNAIFGRCNNLGIGAIPITDATNSLIVCGLIIYQTVP